MKRCDLKHLSKLICTALLCTVMFASFGAGCSHADPAQTQPSEPQTNTAEPVQQTLPSEPGPIASEPVLQKTDPAPADTSEPDAGCDALFYGDSITKGNHFEEYFPHLRVVDFGINGATIEDLTERVPEVDAYHPAKIFVMAGGNNLDSHNEDECVELFRGLLDALREACPYAEIYVESMLPLDERIARKADCPNRAIRRFNSRLEELAVEYGMTYLDIYTVYEDHGGLNKEMTKDGVHLEKGCYGPWAEVLRPYLEP